MIAHLTLEVLELNENLLAAPVRRIEAYETVQSQVDLSRMAGEFMARVNAARIGVANSAKTQALKAIQAEANALAPAA